MEEKPNYYAVIPANVRYNENLNSSQKLFYGEITALTYKTGECWASNNYFAKIYKVSPSLITNWVKALEKENLIAVDYEYKDKSIKRRTIRIIGTQNIEHPIQNIEEGYSKYLKENNTSINNTSKKEIYKERPTLEEVRDYCINVRHNNVDYQKFYDYFNEGNWIDSKGNKVKNWKQKVITWEKKTTTKKEFEYEEL